MDLQLIQNKIHEIRGNRVMLDFDLAAMYKIETRRLKEQVKRNKERFPEDFMFQLSEFEWKQLIAICDNLPETVKFSPALPFAFTEQGIAMLSSVLHTPIAIEVNIQIMRTFVVVRQYMLNTSNQSKEIENMKSQIGLLHHDIEALIKDHEIYDGQLDEIYMALSELAKKKKTIHKLQNPIGFKINK